MTNKKVPNRPSWDGESKRLERMLRNNGFEPRQGKGDHIIWRRGSDVISLGTFNIQDKLVWKIIRKFNLEWESVWN